MNEERIRKLGPMSPEEAKEYGTSSMGTGTTSWEVGQEWLDYWGKRAKSALILLRDHEDNLIRFATWGPDDDKNDMVEWLKEWSESEPDQNIMRRLAGEGA